MSPKKLEGWVGDGGGLPLDAIAATVKKVADGTTVTTGATDAAGHWQFTGLPSADEYFVTLVDAGGRAVVRGPWSGELREVAVRDRLEMPVGAVAVLPGGANAYLGTLAFDPAVGAGALDARYVNTSGDTMTGALVVPTLTVGGMAISQTALDTRYVNTAGDTMSGALAVPSLTVAGNDISYPTLDTRYVNASGDAMTGALAVPSLTVAGNAISYPALDARYPLRTDTDPYPGYVSVAGDTMTGALALPANGLNVGTGQLQVSGGNVVASGSALFDGGEFTVRGSAEVATFLVQSAFEAAAGNEVLFYKARGTGIGAPALVNASDVIGNFRFRGHDGAAYQNLALIRAVVDGTPGAGSMPGRLEFWTVPSGSTTQTQRMVINQAGLATFLNGVAVSAGGAAITGNSTVTGTLTVTASPLLLSAVSAGIEIGNQATPNTPLIDFHSSGISQDFDSRIMASGGAAGVGLGTLAITAATTTISAAASVGGVLTVGGQTRISAGSSATPSLAFAGDLDTGLYYSSADQWRAVAGGVDIATFGKVGALGYFAVVGQLSLPITTSGVATPGTVNNRYPIYNTGGVIMGYIPVYNTL